MAKAKQYLVVNDSYDAIVYGPLTKGEAILQVEELLDEDVNMDYIKVYEIAGQLSVQRNVTLGPADDE